MNKLLNTYCITVKGKVQGVFFRKSAKETAEKYLVKGIVKNMENGDVYMELQGNEASLKRMLEWVRRGPEMARVDEMDARIEQKETFRDFSIIR